MKFLQRLKDKLFSTGNKNSPSKKDEEYLKKYTIEDNVVLMDSMTEDFLTSKLPNPKNEDLKILFGNTNYIEIIERKFGKGEDVIRIRCSSEKDLEELRSILLIDEANSNGHWMSVGELEMVFKHNDKELARIELLGAGSLRWYKKWKADGNLSSRNKLLLWLDKFGVPEPLNRAKEDEERIEKERQFHEHWLSFAPKTVVDFMERKGIGDCLYDVSEIKGELIEEIPNTYERIRKLLGLYGTTKNFWTAYPIYEDIPKDLLIEYETSMIVEAVQEFLIIPEIKYGFVRFSCSREVFNSRMKTYKSLAPEIKTLMLEVMEETDNISKKIRRELE